MVDELRKLFLALETAETLDQLDRFPGWRLHPLKGNMKGLWSLTVTGNWRLVESTLSGRLIKPRLSMRLASMYRKLQRSRKRAALRCPTFCIAKPR